MKYTFKRHRTDKIPRKKIIEELIRVAKLFNYSDFSYREFNNAAKINADTAKVEFGTWLKAKNALKESLRDRNIELKPRSFRQKYSEKDLFDEMDRIWKKLGHRPSSREWEAMDTKVSSTTYLDRFSGWANACLRFIEYKNGTSIVDDIMVPKEIKNTPKEPLRVNGINNPRTIPLGLRLKVLDRDNFKCVYCGKSPSTDFGVKLHIDHIKPFSRGGKNTFDNLQTLCYECNLGKSNKEIIIK